MSLLKEAKEVAPGILVIDNAIDNPQKIIDMALKKDLNDFSDATVFNSRSEIVVDQDIRDTVKINIAPSYREDAFWWILSQKIWKYGDEYGTKFGVRFSAMEDPEFLWYKSNRGFFSTHSDSGTIQRIFSTVLYLNDVDDGGETFFDKFDISVKPRAGRMIMFPGNFVYTHGAKIPKSNDKFAVVTWFHP